MARERERDLWFKFYMNSWIKDTRHLTLEQRGAYIDMIVLQMQNGEAIKDDYKWLSHQLHISSRKAASIVESLIELTVIQRTDAGLSNPRAEFEINSRLVQLRSKSESALNRERTKREYRQNVNEINEGQAQGHHNIREREREEDKTLGQSDLIDRAECGSKPDRAKPRKKPTDAQFTAFWDAYPRRVKKAEARKKFLSLTPDDASLAIQGARSYAREVAADGRDASKIMHPTTYLNQRVFEDIQDASTDAAAPEPVDGKAWGFWRAEREQWAKYSPAAWRAALDKAKPNGTWPWWLLGPPPGHHECLVHPTVVAERGLAEVYQGKIHHHD
jgi:uncharacterized protein YdaU (DUF1376 family)